MVEQIKLEKEFISFGRLDKCDVLCEHPSLSRFHAVLQYSNGEDDKDFPEGFYVYDLASTHGTFINKTRLEPNKYIRFNIESMVKFGLSTRMYILHGPKSKNNADDLNINLTHEQMRKIKEKYNQLSLKLKIRQEIEEEDQLEEQSKKSANWGMSEIEDESQTETDENAVNPFSGIRDVWDRYATGISMFISVQYAVIIVMLCAVFLKYGIMEFCRVLLSSVFVDLYGITDRKAVRKMYEPTSVEMEPMIRNSSILHHVSSAPTMKM